MPTELELVPEFGVLHPLVMRAFAELQHGDPAQAALWAARTEVLADAIGDEATLRYALYVRGRALLDVGLVRDGLDCVEELVARTAQDAQPYWHAKGLGVRAMGLLRAGNVHEVIDVLAQAWVHVGDADGRVYNQVSAANMMANALRAVELYERSDALLSRLWRVAPRDIAASVVVDCVRTVAEWAVSLTLAGRETEASHAYAVLASRAALLRRVALPTEARRTELVVDVAEALAAVGLGEPETALERLARLGGEPHRGRPEWMMATCARASALIRTGSYDAAERELRTLAEVAERHTTQVWSMAAAGLRLRLAQARHGSHPAVPVAMDMYRRAAGQLWAEHAERFDLMRTRVEVHQLLAERDRATELSLIDALTGVANRRALQSRLDRARGPVVAMFVDVDDFKRVNDDYSHAVGDAVLVRVAELLRGQLRPGDLLARFGGDEFILLLAQPEGVDLGEARRTAGRIVEAVRAEDWAGVAPGLAVTVSVGVARVDEREQLLETLSRAVREAKRGGRDQAALAGPSR